MRVTVRRRFWGRDAIRGIARSGQGPSAVLFRRRPPVVRTADTRVSGPRRVEPLHLFNGQPYWRRRLQGHLPGGLLQATARSGAVRRRGLRALASPSQPRGVAEEAGLARVAMHLQRVSLPGGEMQFPGRAAPVEGGGLGERGGAVSGQRVGRRASRVAEGTGSQAWTVGRLVGQAAGSQGHGGLPGEAQRAVPLDGEFGGVATELLVVLDDVGVRRGDAAGVVDVVMLYFLLG